MTSGSSYGWCLSTACLRASKRSFEVFTSSSASASLCTAPFQRYTDDRLGTTLTQAATRSSTSAAAMPWALSGGHVTSTTRTSLAMAGRILCAPMKAVPATPKKAPVPPFVFAQPPPVREGLRAAITAAWLADETGTVRRLVADADVPEQRAAAVQATAAGWVRRVRALRDKESPLDAFMREYDLSSEEGVLLMCLAEA